MSDSLLPVRGEVALVTASTRGIGRACAIALAQAGAAVAIGSRDIEAGRALAKLLESRGARACAVTMDMTDLAAVSSGVHEVERQLGTVTVLVNNAGQSHPAPALAASPSEFDSMFALNVRSAFFASQAVARRLVETRRSGSIVNIASQAGLVALRDESIYCMTKAAMIQMTRCHALEWAAHGIRVNAVAPTFVRTDGTRRWLEDPTFLDSVLTRIPLGRVGEPDDVANPVVFLASPAAAMVTGATLSVDGGWTVS